MKRIIFEGKITLAGKDVDFRIYEIKGEQDQKDHYEWETNPLVIGVSQIDAHHGETNCADDLDRLLYRIDQFKREITEIKATKPNPLF